MSKLPISVQGMNKLKDALKHLKEVERPAILAAVQTARELGDLSENADYKTAKDQQRHIDAEIRRIEGIVNNADVIDVDSLTGTAIMFGANVTLEDEDGAVIKYKILSEHESDLSLGVISITSPIARSMVGKSKGDGFVVRTPSGEKEYTVIDVKYGRD